MSRKWLAAAVVAPVAAAILLLPGGGGARTVWCLMEGSIASIRTAPDGAEVPHAATMMADEAPWAYYYDVPTWFTDVLDALGFGYPRITNLLATGRETITASGRWVEFVRSDDEEFEAVLGWWRRRVAEQR